MTTSIQAIYEKGVFRPIHEVALSEGTRVEVLIPEAQCPRQPQEVAAKLASIADHAAVSGKSDHTSSDPDAILYSRKSRS